MRRPMASRFDMIRAMVKSETSQRILEDCRGAVGEVRFGFGSKRQIWAFDERHKLAYPSVLEELLTEDPAEFLRLAIAFHDEFAAVSGAWRVRDAMQFLSSRLCRNTSPAVLSQVVEALVDDKLALRHWLVSALLSAPAGISFPGLEAALQRAYQTPDHWAVLARLQSIATDAGLRFGAGTSSRLATLAQFSPRPEDRRRALDLLAGFGAAGSSTALANAARGDADPAIRAHAAELLAKS